MVKKWCNICNCRGRGFLVKQSINHNKSLGTFTIVKLYCLEWLLSWYLIWFVSELRCSSYLLRLRLIHKIMNSTVINFERNAMELKVNMLLIHLTYLLLVRYGAPQDRCTVNGHLSSCWIVNLGWIQQTGTCRVDVTGPMVDTRSVWLLVLQELTIVQSIKIKE